MSRQNIYDPCKKTPIGIGKKLSLKQTIIVPTCTIIHPSLDVIIIRYVQDIPNNLCSRNRSKNVIQIHPIIMTDADYDSILDEIERREKKEFESNVSDNSDKE